MVVLILSNDTQVMVSVVVAPGLMIPRVMSLYLGDGTCKVMVPRVMVPMVNQYLEFWYLELWYASHGN